MRAWAAAALLLWSGGAFGGTTVDSEAGLQVISTQETTPLLDCGSDVVREGFFEVDPTFKNTDGTEAVRILGATSADQSGNRTFPDRAEADLDVTRPMGRHVWRLGLSDAYFNERRLLCIGGLEAHLERQQAIAQKLDVSGASVRTQKGSAGYEYDGAGSKTLVDYTARSDEGDSQRNTQDLTARHERQLSAATMANVRVGAGTDDDTGKTYPVYHGGAGVDQQVTGRLKAGVDQTIERRDRVGLGYDTSAQASYLIDAQTKAAAGIERALWTSSPRLTERTGFVALAYADPIKTATAQARRTEVQDAPFTAGNHYQVNATDMWMPRHTVGLKLASGTDAITLVKSLETAEVDYWVLLAGLRAPKEPGHVYASLSESRVVDYSDQVAIQRVITVGAVATF